MTSPRPDDRSDRIPARLFGLDDAAEYTATSYWTMRDLVIAGRIPHVRLPAPRSRDGRSLRRILIDRADLDRFLDSCKETGIV